MNSLSSLTASRWFLGGIVALAFVLRLHHLTTPLADWHSFRQADTASVTREYVKHGIDLLHPRYHDLASIQSGKDNLEGYRMVEFPLVNAMIAVLLRTVPSLPLVITSRLFSIAFSLGTLLGIYFFVKAISGRQTALAAAFAWAVLPYSMFYSRTVMPEIPMIFFSMTALATWQTWLTSRKWQWYVASWLSLMVALLLKPFVAFMAPVFFLTLVLEQPRTWWKNLGVYFYATTALPFWWWRQWIVQFPSGIPASSWLFNSLDGVPIRFRPAWVRWLAYERLTKMWSGFTGVIFLAAAFLNFKAKDTWIYLSWWLGMVGYVTVIAAGNVRHDYYQLLMLPLVCITLGKGAVVLWQWLKQRWSSRVAWTVVLNIAVWGWIMAWQQVGGLYQINHWEYVEAGTRVDQLTPADAKVIAPAFGDTVFLFQTNRTGWPIGYYIDKKIADGAQYYVTTAFDDEANDLMKRYTIIEKTEKYVIIDLTRPVGSLPKAPEFGLE